ncbi:thiamine pyrophosphate-dependent enzyme [Caldimonas thermodepolymerans]|jgi:sulfopyruvate decarboxylase TPP-binding subunit|uniref:Sulfopyruvate decarboxylase TPP-binding subunit n=1 Tax=Caldimonas thermodepolymerans TaxID=215580 RepID=A0AA46DAA6_9BURK|nr:thiamine pyrophosphate-dependent enzyme [Caldimonas thermodepolymerans]TCP02426.1 sulfopyruvate decarboxylase TPP-binding subunit [Caldimonas thermodepolymerans]UZG48051.1 thiamine pyrophosphate-dependent enzyme [Caldimonas thermodepolymerans]
MPTLLKRFDFLAALAGVARDDLVVTNLANTATEWHAARPSHANLYAVGMGLVTSYALGVALARPEQSVIALDGDGGIFFDTSILGTIAAAGAANLTVVVFDNGGYVSTGRLPDVASLAARVDIATLARAYGLAHVHTVEQPEALVACVREARETAAPTLVVVKVNAEQAFVGPLPMDLKENKYQFVRHVEQAAGIRILKPSAKEHGARPAADPASHADAQAGFAHTLHAALKDNGIDFVIGLPCSGLSGAQSLLMQDREIRYLPVAHEGTGVGICAGAWLGGKRPAALIENFGLFASVYHLLRGHFSHGIPTLLMTEYRGDTGDQEFFAETGEVTPDLLRAMRVNHRVIADAAQLMPAVRDAWRWMDACLRPFAILPTFELTRLKR